MNRRRIARRLAAMHPRLETAAGGTQWVNGVFVAAPGDPFRDADVADMAGLVSSCLAGGMGPAEVRGLVPEAARLVTAGGLGGQSAETLAAKNARLVDALLLTEGAGR